MHRSVEAARKVTVFHYDADFDHIASVTGQPTEWIVERGSVNRSRRSTQIPARQPGVPAHFVERIGDADLGWLALSSA